MSSPSAALLGWDSPASVLPDRPGKIIVIGRNYSDRVDVDGAPPTPLAVFFKPSTSLVGTGQSVQLPPGIGDVRFEGELAVVIGMRCKNVRPDDFREVVLGYTCADDVTAWEVGTATGHWSKAKGFDTFCPLGPRVVRDLDPTNVVIRTRVNGQIRQEGNTSQLVRSVPQLISEVSSLMTLEPGDVLLTGTPAGAGVLHPGDSVEVEIEGIGSLVHTVERAAA
ncbi:fumarylacetoacetate hydrolase family protein [Gordonia sp. CPCC 205333]|uniref:fumarylacetoacetate hydrolase family protein n=1 Tax=Gordonia sp. CPCC 205333 TaxID=3140790 RepID=UPI003AF37AD0